MKLSAFPFLAVLFANFIGSYGFVTKMG